MLKLALRINREDDFYDQLYNLSNTLHILIVTTRQLNFGHREFSSCVLLSRFELRRYILVILWGHSRTLSRYIQKQAGLRSVDTSLVYNSQDEDKSGSNILHRGLNIIFSLETVFWWSWRNGPRCQTERSQDTVRRGPDHQHGDWDHGALERSWRRFGAWDRKQQSEKIFSVHWRWWTYWRFHLLKILNNKARLSILKIFDCLFSSDCVVYKGCC